MGILPAHLAPIGDALRPVHDQGIGDAAPVGLPFPTAERGVARKGPAPGVVVEVLGAAQLIEHRQLLLHRAGEVVVPHVHIHHPGRSPFRTRPVVRHQHHDRVLEGVEAPQEGQQPADLMVGVLQEAGEHLHHPGIEPPLLRAALRPGFHIRIMPRQHAVLRDHPKLLLPGKGPLPIHLPPLIKRARITIGPVLGHVVGRVHGPGGEVEKERLLGIHLAGIGDETHRPIHQIFREVVALLGRLGGLHLVIVGHQLGVVLVRVAP